MVTTISATRRPSNGAARTGVGAEWTGRPPVHGLYRLKRAVVELGSRALPSRKTALGRALHEWRASLLADLGGEGALSARNGSA